MLLDHTKSKYCPEVIKILIRVGGLRGVKIKYMLAYFSLSMPLFGVLMTAGHYLDFNLSTDKVWSKSKSGIGSCIVPKAGLAHHQVANATLERSRENFTSIQISSLNLFLIW